MPVPIPGPEVGSGSDSQKVKFLPIFGRPKTGFFDQISRAPGYIPPIPASYQPRRQSRACRVSVRCLSRVCRAWGGVLGLVLGKFWVGSGRDLGGSGRVEISPKGRYGTRLSPDPHQNTSREETLQTYADRAQHTLNISRSTKIIPDSSRILQASIQTAWLVASGFWGKVPPRGFGRHHPGKTVYPRETPRISSSGPKNKIGGVFGHACADSGPRS